MKAPKNDECVKVVVRCRPLSDMEKKQGHKKIVDVDVKRGVIMVHNSSVVHEPPRQFTFDAVYDCDSHQKSLYTETFSDLVQSVLNGFNGTIFAYGQTGTGKTFTMTGIRDNPEMAGVIPNSFNHIFDHIAHSKNEQYLVRASYLEIYQEEIRDLLSKNQTTHLELKERPDTGVYVKDLSSFVTKAAREIDHIMNVGNQNRSVGATKMNENSSRSHAIFVVTIECSERREDGEDHIRVGRLNMVDLAGSERQAKTETTGERFKESTKINLSLSALGNVISALVDGRSTHIPYRDSKLTRLLQDSLGGNARTVMVANIGPANYNYEETLNTLRYANRAKNIKNKPRINEDPKDALLRQFQDELARLKKALSEKGGNRKSRSKSKRHGHGQSEAEVESGEEAEETLKEYRNKRMQQLEEEKRVIESNSSLVRSEKEKLLKEMEGKEELLAKEMQSKEQMALKIASMESKLLMGGQDVDLQDHTALQEQELDRKKKELAKKEREERELRQKLEEKEETAINLQGSFGSLQQEVDMKTKKLKKLFAKLQAKKLEKSDLQDEYSKERRELESTLENLQRNLKLKKLIVENFIPPEEKAKIMSRAVFDDENDCWILKPLMSIGASQNLSTRPMSAHGRFRALTNHSSVQGELGYATRYLGENIMCLDLDMPIRTTRDFEEPDLAPSLQSALDVALQEEEDIDIGSSDSMPMENAKQKNKKRRNILRRPRPSDPEHYPKARGLVPE